jgi:membrane protein YqaA with SNARE-associated domain
MLESFSLYFEDFGLVGLFIICFLSASILPLSSEIVLFYFLSLGNYNPILLLMIASFGNCLGGLTNYFLGFYGNKYFLKKVNFENKLLLFFQKKGFYAAFFSWIPIIGDPLLISLGILKTHFWKTVFFMCLGKIFRYALLIFLY